MKIASALVRRWLRLPPARAPIETATAWIPLSDGVRLATTIAVPATGGAAPTVLMRTQAPAHGRAHAAGIVARLLAEQGFATVVQECRGRYASEGVFTPFAHEARDGGEALRWVAEQPFCDGRVALLGIGYSGFAAWAALSSAPEAVRALVVALAARDPRTLIHRGGAFALADALRLAVGLGGREQVPERRLDLERALAFLPVREADRVALRRVDAFRDWVDHPVRDDFWRGIEPAMPDAPPPALLIAGSHHPALAGQLEDHADLAKRGTSRPLELSLGPWHEGRMARAERGGAGGFFGFALREATAFLERALAPTPARAAPVRVFVRGGAAGRAAAGGHWRQGPSWPLPGCEPQRAYLRSGGRANGATGDGLLSDDPPERESPDRFLYDPSDPVPTRGGCVSGRGAGPADARDVQSRADVLCYTTPPREAPIDLVGPVRVVLIAASSAPDTDFSARLTCVTTDGAAIHVCDGIARARWRDGGAEPVWLEPERPTRFEIDLGSAVRRVERGERLRLEISSSNFPRFDRHPNTRDAPGAAELSAPAQQTVFHDGGRASHVILPVLR